MGESSAKEKPKSGSGRKNLINTFIVAGSTLASRILGFVRNALIAYFFGGGGTADVLLTVFTLPNNLRKLMAEGGLSSAFIPVFSDLIVKDPSQKRGRELAKNIIALQALILVPILILSTVFSGPIINVLTNFPDPQQTQLAEEIFRYFIWYILFISISALMMGVLNAKEHFLVPALTPTLFSLMVISALLLLTDHLFVFSMAAGVLLGGVAQIAFQFPLFHKLGFSLFPSFNFKNDDFKRVLKKWGPALGTGLVFALSQQVSVTLATYLKEGSAAAMNNALLFYQLPASLFGISITTVLFPKMSRLKAEGKKDALSSTFFQGLSFLAVFLVPSAIGLAFLGKDIISVFLLRGAFLPVHVENAAAVLVMYSLGILGIAGFNFIQRFFFSMGNFRLPLIIAIGTGILDIVLSIVIVFFTDLGAEGLALAFSFSFTLGFIVSVFFAVPYLSPSGLKSYFLTLIKVFSGSSILGLFLWFYSQWRGDKWLDGASIENLTFLFGAVILSGVLVLGIFYLMKIDMIAILKRKKNK